MTANKLKALLAAASTAVLVACGGGGGGTAEMMKADPLAAIPASATASPSAYQAYQAEVLALPTSQTDRAEPIDVSNLTLAQSDTTEPFDTN